MFLFPTFFFFNDTATTEIYTLSLHDALPICVRDRLERHPVERRDPVRGDRRAVLRGRVAHVRVEIPARVALRRDRKSTRLNSSHANISYAVFCLKKKRNLSTRIMIIMTAALI